MTNPAPPPPLLGPTAAEFDVRSPACQAYLLDLLRTSRRPYADELFAQIIQCALVVGACDGTRVAAAADAGGLADELEDEPIQLR